MIAERVAADELSVEFVLSADLADALRTNRAKALAGALNDGASLWRTEQSVPFGVFVVHGETKQMGIEFRDGTLQTGLLLNESAESITWAESQIDNYVSDAERVTAEA